MKHKLLIPILTLLTLVFSSALPVLHGSDSITTASGSHSSSYEDGETYVVASNILSSIGLTPSLSTEVVRSNDKNPPPCGLPFPPCPGPGNAGSSLRPPMPLLLIASIIKSVKAVPVALAEGTEKAIELVRSNDKNPPPCGLPFPPCPGPGNAGTSLRPPMPLLLIASIIKSVKAVPVALAEGTEKAIELVRSNDKNPPPCGLPFPPCPGPGNAGSSLRPPMPLLLIASIIKSVKAVPVALAEGTEKAIELVRSNDKNPPPCGLPFPPCPGNAGSSLRAPAPFIFIANLIRAVEAILVLPKRIELGLVTTKESKRDEDLYIPPPPPPTKVEEKRDDNLYIPPPGSPCLPWCGPPDVELKRDEDSLH